MNKYNRSHLFLAALFFLIVGTFWLLGSLQEPLFYHLVGASYHAQGNVLAYFFMLPLLALYGTGVRHFSARRLLIIAASGYAAFFALAALSLIYSPFGLKAPTPSAYNLLGWLVFAAIKSYGSFMVTLFWTYATSATSLETSLFVFPFVTTCAQIGSFGGATLARVGADWGSPTLMGIAIAGMLGMIGVLGLLKDDGRAKASAAPGNFWRGLLLIAKSPYLRGVFVISLAYLFIAAFFDYHMHYLANQVYPLQADFVRFKGLYGQWTNALSFLLSLGFTGIVLRFVGVRWGLLLYPLCTAIAVILAWLRPSFEVIFGLSVAVKALAIAFNNPTKEVVYIPESEAVRREAKGWIDVAGYRTMFALGYQITSFIAQPYDFFLQASTLIAIPILVVWGYCAWSIGRRFAPSSE